MNEEKRALLVMCAHFLSYPGKTFKDEAKQMEAALLGEEGMKQVKQTLQIAYAPLSRLSTREMQECYVETFDMKAPLGLYLTAHEYGDSTKRGSALIKLQKIINEAGFDRVEGELADYIPMLFEFLAVADETVESKRLYKRLAIAIHRMVNNIDEEHPYANILQFLMSEVFPNPTTDEVKQLENNREEADLEELPYPIMYQ